MCGHSNLAKRGSTYYARIAVPKDLIDARALAGTTAGREVWKSLGTKEKGDAKKLLRGVLDLIESGFADELEALRAPAIAAADTATESEIRAAVADDIHRLRDSDERGRMRGAGSPAERNNLSAVKVQALRTLTGAGDASPGIAVAVDRMAERHGLKIPPGSGAHRFAQRLTARGVVDLLRVLDARNDGDFATGLADPAIAAPPLQPATPAKPTKESPPILELLELHLADRKAKLSVEQLPQKRAAVRDFVALFGEQKRVEDIDRAALRDYKIALQSYPVNGRSMSTRNTVFRGMDFPQIVAANRVHKLPVIKDKTINSTLSHLGRFCKWLGANGYIPDGSIISGLHIAVDQREGTRDSYTPAELSRLFALPLFRGSEPKDAGKPGTHHVRDHRFWLPLISLFTGTRLGEIAQLETADIREVGEVPTFVFTREGATAKTLKNKYAQRAVPIHPELIRLGFLDYVEATRAAASVRLFPLLAPDAKRGRLSATASAQLRKYLKRFAMQEFGFARFRHTLTDALRDAGFMDEQITAIVGHKSGGTQTDRYGSTSAVTDAMRKKMIDAVKFPSVDLSDLHVRGASVRLFRPPQQ